MAVVATPLEVLERGPAECNDDFWRVDFRGLSASLSHYVIASHGASAAIDMQNSTLHCIAPCSAEERIELRCCHT